MCSKYPLSIVTGIISIFFMLNSCSSNKCSNDNPLNDFALKDTASITKFKITNTEGNSIEISRRNMSSIWKINETDFIANKSSVDLITETFYRIKVRQDVPRAALNTIMNRLSVKHKKIEIFKEEDKPFKTWYIGSPTQDHLGTYMLLQNKECKSSIPFITYKPGMNGSLDVRFFTSLNDWRSSKVFDYSNSNNIIRISVDFNITPKESYIIERENNSVLLYDGMNNKIMNYDTIQVKHYLTHFNKINFNKIINFKKEIVDSVFSLTPHVSFKLDDINQTTKIVDFWKIRDDNSETGWDKEYGFIRIDNKYELLRVQYFNWDILFKPLSYFK
tara:strand:+ start:605 stop:1600 length:996 start_codon:yes stop_codon:yes gene_type:complete